jgi:nitroreductase
MLPEDYADALIHGRAHVSPKRLIEPGPTAEQKKRILDSAKAAPDHGRNTPWHFIEISESSRPLLGSVFKLCLSDRDPQATPIELQEAQDKALRGPLLLLAIAKLGITQDGVSEQEKMISLGCAIQNILLSAHALGYGSGLSSGKAITSVRLRQLFKLSPNELPICFITIGTVSKNKSGSALRPNLSTYHSIF